MKIAIVTHDFRNSAEGICTARLATALTTMGAVVRVITAAPSVAVSDVVVTSVSAGPSWWTRLMSAIERRLPGFSRAQTWLWRRRVCRLPIDSDTQVIYARAYPPASFWAAQAVAKRHQKPLAIHFSDPIPNPWSGRALLLRRQVRAVVAESVALTATNTRAAAYIADALSIPSNRIHVAPHIAEELQVGPAPIGGENVVFLHLGGFYKQRRPDALLTGFARHTARYPLDELRLVGSMDSSSRRATQRLRARASISIEGPKPAVPEYSKAHVLIVVDSFVEPHVFLPSKLVECMGVNRVLLVITPPKSPSALLARECGQSVVVVESEDPDAIAVGMEACRRAASRSIDLAERRRILEELSGRRVAENLCAALTDATSDRVGVKQ